MDQLLDFGPVFDNLDLILGGFWATIRIAVVTAVLSLIFGTFLAALRVSPVPVLRHTGGVVVNTLRNTPLTLVLAICIMAVNDTLQVRLDRTSGRSTSGRDPSPQTCASLVAGTPTTELVIPVQRGVTFCLLTNEDQADEANLPQRLAIVEVLSVTTSEIRLALSTYRIEE